MTVQRVSLGLAAISWWLGCEYFRSKTRPTTNASILLGWLGLGGGLTLFGLAFA
jgi:hypothetical protein